jgi:hypothetical protein
MPVKVDVGSQSAEAIKFCFRIGCRAKALARALPDKRGFQHPDDERREGAYGGFPLAWHEPTLICTELNSQVKPSGRKLLGEITKLMIHGKSPLEFAVSVKKGEMPEAPEL